MLKKLKKIYTGRYYIPPKRYEEARKILFTIRSFSSEQADAKACKFLKVEVEKLDAITNYEVTVPHPEKDYLLILKAVDYYKQILKLL